MTEELDELRKVARSMPSNSAGWRHYSDAGGLGLEVVGDLGGTAVTFPAVAGIRPARVGALIGCVP